MDIYTVKNGDAALNLIKSIPETIEILIIDAMLPDGTGKEIVNKIKQSFPNIKILYLSVYIENVFTKDGITIMDINFYRSLLL